MAVICALQYLGKQEHHVSRILYWNSCTTAAIGLKKRLKPQLLQPMSEFLNCPSKIRWYVLHCDDSKNRGEMFYYDLIKKKRPILSKEGSQTVRYEVSDMFLRFWFRYRCIGWIFSLVAQMFFPGPIFRCTRLRATSLSPCCNVVFSMIWPYKV